MKRIIVAVFLVAAMAGCGEQPTPSAAQDELREAYGRGRTEALASSGYDDGYRKGRKEGYNAGFEAGKSQGYANGYRAGKDSVLNGDATDDPAEGRYIEQAEVPPDEWMDHDAVYTMKYVVNTSSHVFHYPACGHAGRISAANKKEVETTREQLVSDGYRPCEVCQP